MRRSGGVHFVLIAGVLALCALVVGATVFLQDDGSSESLPQKIQEVVNVAVPAPTPTPFPFQELTIPYLRNREFNSQLGELNKYSENGNYTSYLTSYDSDGFQVNGLLTIPKNGNQKHPAVIFVHGYIPPEEYETTQNYASYVDFLARSGFVVFKIDLRGHGNSEGESGGGYYSGEYVIDTLNARAALQVADFVSPEAIGLWGHSMSGNVTFRSFVAAQDIAAIVVWAGAGYTYSDLSDYQIDDNSYRPPPPDSERARKREELRDTYGSFDPASEFWKQVTPVNYLEGVSGAMQVHHALDDNVVSIEYGRNIMNVLDNTQITHELYEYPSGGHNLTGASFTIAMQRAVEFFKNELK